LYLTYDDANLKDENLILATHTGHCVAIHVNIYIELGMECKCLTLTSEAISRMRRAVSEETCKILYSEAYALKLYY
jgi:hypothetical protein